MKKEQEQIVEDFQTSIEQSSKSPMQFIDQKDGRTRLRVQFDITYKGSPGKIPLGESQTEPDMTLRLGQLLERHTRGQNVPVREPIYFDTEIPTITDLSDVERYREQLQRRLNETNKFIEDELKEDQEKSKNSNKPKAKQPGDQLELKDDPTYSEKK